MAVPTFFSDFGNCTVPDSGELSYNNVIFGALLKTKVNGHPLPDNANRTIKAVEWTIDAEGVVTLGTDEVSTDATLKKLRQNLTKPGGQLKYVGKGFSSLVVNKPGDMLRDIAWGPKPKLLEFTPLGGSNAAMVKWSVTTTIPELSTGAALAPLPIVQFNEDISISYDEDCYSRISISGTIEMPLTWRSVSDRTLARTIDNYRKQFLDIDMDPTRFRVTRREFRISRDKRTCEWEFIAEELPPMGLPVWATSARGTFSIRPLRQSYALFPWLCSLRATYVVRKDYPRRTAWLAFLMLLMFRMGMSALGEAPGIEDRPIARRVRLPRQIKIMNSIPKLGTAASMDEWVKMINKLQTDLKAVPGITKAYLIHLGIDEGLYLDSKTVTFEASWRLFVSFETLLAGTGLWRWTGMEGGKLWAQSVSDIQGWKSWMTNTIDPGLDVIIDLGGDPVALLTTK